MDDAEKAKKLMRGTPAGPPPFKEGLSTGSTLLNLACTGRPSVGLLPGHYYFLVGDSASGKTFLSLTCMAEAANNPNYRDYRFIFDNVEHGALMSMERFFGRKMANRLEPPAIDRDGEPVFSSTVEDFYYHLDDACQQGRPFIYVLDSMDSLTSEDESRRFRTDKKNYRKAQKGEGGAEAKGSFGDGKAKKNSAGLRRFVHLLKKSGSILIIINQTRDNLNAFSFEKKTRSGGNALRFYTTVEMWSSIKGVIKKSVRGEQRPVGITCQIRLKKNRITGRHATVEIPIYYSHGIDDVGSCVEYLIAEGHWAKSGANITATEFDFRGPVEKLVRQIEYQGLEKRLRLTVAQVHAEIEEGCKVKRKPRYE